MMNSEKGWNFKKGNQENMPVIRQSEAPIGKEGINESILEYLYEKTFEENGELLKVSDFNMQFLCMGEDVAFIEFNIMSGGGKKIDLKLTGQDAKGFVDLIRDIQFDGNKPSEN